VLSVPNWLLTRQRSNPFHAYLVERVRGWLDVRRPADADAVAVEAVAR
jgi:hypothetical protein